MVTRSADCKNVAVNIRNGKGTPSIKHLTDVDGMYRHGRVFAHLTLQPGESIGDHPHVDETEFYYILKGEGLFNDNGTAVTVCAGDVCATGFGEVHGLENTGAEPMELIALIITANAI